MTNTVTFNLTGINDSNNPYILELTVASAPKHSTYFIHNLIFKLGEIIFHTLQQSLFFIKRLTASSQEENSCPRKQIQNAAVLGSTRHHLSFSLNISTRLSITEQKIFADLFKILSHRLQESESLDTEILQKILSGANVCLQDQGNLYHQ